jgi:hypothetical protein
MDGAKPSGKDKRFFLVEHLLNVGITPPFHWFPSPHYSPSRNGKTQEGKKEEELRSSFSLVSFTFLFL